MNSNPSQVELGVCSQAFCPKSYLNQNNYFKEREMLVITIFITKLLQHLNLLQITAKYCSCFISVLFIELQYNRAFTSHLYELG